MSITQNRTETHAEAWNLRLIGHSDLNGHGDGSQLIRHGDYLLVGHMASMGTSILDVSDPTQPRVVKQLPHPSGPTHSHKVQIAGDVLIVNHEQYTGGHDGPAPTAQGPHSAGIQVFDISDPANPRELSFFHTGGKGVHRSWFADGKYAYLSARPDGYRERIFIIVDVSEPTRPQEVGRWWLPGLWEGGGETLDGWPSHLRYGMHHGVVEGERAYIGCLDAGIAILDISDRSQPTTLARLSWLPEESRDSHTVLPLPNRDLLVVSEEAVQHNCEGVPHQVRLIDVSDERNPREVSRFPIPEGDFCRRGLRFGPHNLHENRPGSFISDQRVYVTYFNAGLRVVDISDPTAPREIAYYVPEAPPGQPACQINDVYVDQNGLVYISDRGSGGVYILEPVGF